MKVKDILEEISDEETEEKKSNWHTLIRRHTFSELLQERFLLSLPDEEELPKDKWKEIVESGLLIEENEQNIRYLIKQQDVENSEVTRESEAK